jgi:tRNA modification GTPase
LFDTIVAIATPMGKGSVGILRLSGDQAKSIVQMLCPTIIISKPRHVYFTNICHPDTSAVIDQGCVIYFKSPASYTGEECVEIQAHGSYYILQQLISVCVHKGARMALPGEFTKRAFLNGKLGLSQAESVHDLIQSDSEKSHAVALSHVQGKLFKHIQSCRDVLSQMYQRIEASIDFPDEVDGIDRDEALRIVTAQCDQFQEILSYQSLGETVKHGINSVIVGQPNVGKSSLFNALVGRERAIVTHLPGTTRDYLSESYQLGGMTVNLFDTAGMRETEDYIEHLGIEKITDLINTASCLFWVVDATQALTTSDRRIFTKIQHHKSVIIIGNKSDQLDDVDAPSPAQRTMSDAMLMCPYMGVSALTTNGINQINTYLYNQFITQVENADLALLCNVRQLNCISDALAGLQLVKDGLNTGIEDDVISASLRQSILKLGEVTGDAFTEETLDQIFSQFCIGK